MDYQIVLRPTEEPFIATAGATNLLLELRTVLGHEPDRGEVLALKQRLELIIAELEGRKPRSITPGPGSVNAKSLIRAVLRLSAGAWIDVELDGDRRVSGVSVDGIPITEAQWLALQQIGLIKLTKSPGSYSTIDPSRK